MYHDEYYNQLLKYSYNNKEFNRGVYEKKMSYELVFSVLHV